MTDIQIEVHTALEEAALSKLVELERAVFEKPLDAAVIRNELFNRAGLIVLLARVEGSYRGYKVGYRLSATDDYFYSWIGGVHPDYRRRGIARLLMERQHQLAREAGCSYVRTKTRNKYKSMLILNLKVGFDVCGLYHKLDEQHPGIVLEKRLLAPVALPC